KVGASSGAGLATVNAASRSGSETRSQVPRYVRPLIGRSSEPRRRRRRRVGVASDMRGYSRNEICHLSLAGLCMPEFPTILLVDDEDAIQKLLTYPLEREGFRVVSARDGQEALDQFTEANPDLVVLDIMLPRVDGLEVCKRLRARSTVPIIMLTAR